MYFVLPHISSQCIVLGFNKKLTYFGFNIPLVCEGEYNLFCLIFFFFVMNLICFALHGL